MKRLAATLCVLALALGAPRAASAVPWYLWQFAEWRQDYNTDGTLDAGFGTGGILTVDFFGASDGAEDVVIQPDGKIVVVGVARNGTSNGLGLARVLP